MIVKDEEDWITQCLSSVEGLVSEMIVVDTGSSDKTVEIARSLGAKVFHEKWQDDFAAARNISLAHATGEWILMLDADECIAPSDKEAVYALTGDRGVCTEFLQRHYTNDHRLSEFTPCSGEFPDLEKGNAGYFESNCCRLFPNGEGLHFQGRVHELVEHSIYQLKKHRIVRTGVRIHHFGHTDQVKKKKKKGTLYSPLGEVKTKEEPANWKAFYELGVEHNVNGRKKESVEAFKRSLELNPDYVPSWVNCGYAQMELGEFKDAVQSYEQAILRDPSSSEAYCNLGVVGMRTGNLKLAEDASLRAISLVPTYVNALCNLGRIYVMAGRLAEGVAVLQHTLRVLPQCTVAKSDLGATYLQAGVLDEAERYLSEAIVENPDYSKNHFNIGQLYRISSRIPEALTSFRRFAALEDAAGTPEEVPQEIRELLQTR